MPETHPLWSERWRPHKIEECILPKGLKTIFLQYAKTKAIPNLILSGKPGTGKTTVAKALLEQIGAEFVVFNGSLNVDKDALRNEITAYASSMSLEGGRKFVILDEADYLSAVHVQPALRNFMDEFSDGCGFILTCNHKNRIIDPLQSRCTVVDFTIPGNEAASLAQAFMERLCHILTVEKVEFDKRAVVAMIKRHYPDFRRTLNELQRYALFDKIDTGILGHESDSLDGLLVHIKAKDFTSVRSWMADNTDVDAPELFKSIYERICPKLQPNAVPPLVLILAKYSYQHAFAANPSLNTLACLAEIMAECSFKA